MVFWPVLERMQYRSASYRSSLACIGFCAYAEYAMGGDGTARSSSGGAAEALAAGG